MGENTKQNTFGIGFGTRFKLLKSLTGEKKKKEFNWNIPVS